MERRNALAGLVSLPLALAGCAYYRESRDPAPVLREVGVVEWDEAVLAVLVPSPGEKAVMFVGSALLLGGPGIAGTSAFIAGTSSGPTQQFNEAMSNRKPWLAATMRQKLTEAAAARSVRIVAVPLPENAKTDIFVSGAPDFSGSTMPLLLVIRPWVVGYANEGSRFEPAADIAVSLLTRTHEIFYHKRFGYGVFADGPKGTSIPSAPRYHFKSVGELLASPDLAIEGLRAGAQPIVDIVVRDLAAKGSIPF